MNRVEKEARDLHDKLVQRLASVLAQCEITLIGNGQKDVKSGGSGVDTFVFHPGFGRDTIGQFNPNQDVLAFAKAMFPSTVTSDASLANYVLSHTVQAAGGSVISFGGQSTITLTDVAKSSLVATDFHLIS